MIQRLRVASSNPGRSGARIFFSRVNFVYRLFFGVHSTPHTPFTQRNAAVQALCGNLSENELTRNSSGNTQPQLSQLVEPLRTDPGVKSGISVRELIPAKNTKTKTKQNNLQAGMNDRTFFQNSRTRGKTPPPPVYLCV